MLHNKLYSAGHVRVLGAIVLWCRMFQPATAMTTSSKVNQSHQEDFSGFYSPADTSCLLWPGQAGKKTNYPLPHRAPSDDFPAPSCIESIVFALSGENLVEPFIDRVPIAD